MTTIEGLFEVHLITKPEYQTQLFGYITDLHLNFFAKRLVNPRPTCAHALYGDHPIQPMLTFWVSGESEEVTALVFIIAEDMLQKSIPIVRVKIEAMAHNQGVPDVCMGDHYFEFHWKVDIKSTADWNQLVQILTPFGGHLFYNPYSKTMKPIITLRRYTSLTDLEALFVSVKRLLKEEGRRPNRPEGFECEAPEKEYSVYDSCVDLDRNWLFRDDSRNFIVDVTPEMLL